VVTFVGTGTRFKPSSDRSLDHRAGFLGRAAEQFAYETLDALIATGEAAGVDHMALRPRESPSSMASRCTAHALADVDAAAISSSLLSCRR
jgi:hypothetical protein